MALSQRHRSVLFEYLSARVGEEVTAALMAEFPARDGDELVSREFLRAELAELRAEMHRGLAGVQTRVTGTLIGAMAVATTIIVAFG